MYVCVHSLIIKITNIPYTRHNQVYKQMIKFTNLIHDQKINEDADHNILAIFYEGNSIILKS